MRSHNERQLEKFIKLRHKYGEFVRVNNVCVFRSKNKTFCVNIDLYLIQWENEYLTYKSRGKKVKILPHKSIVLRKNEFS